MLYVITDLLWNFKPNIYIVYQTQNLEQDLYKLKIIILKIKKVDYNIANQRFDRYLRKYFKPYTDIKLTDIYSWIRKWKILINNKKGKEDYRLVLGDEIKFNNIETGDKTPAKTTDAKEDKMIWLKLDKIDHMIIYEDNDWIVFNKPAGVVAHPGNNHFKDLSMNDYLDKYCELKKIWKDGGTFKPSFGYRLDKDTSGVLIAAKNYDSLQYINQIIRDREIDKEYMTVVIGSVPAHIICEKAIDRVYSKKFESSHMVVSKTWQESKSEFWNIKSINNNVLWDISMVRVKLYTGRMHQIRIHLASEGYPVLWDIIYGKPMINRKMYKQLKINRQVLHCSRYSFKNINGKKISFEAKLPGDFDKLMT